MPPPNIPELQENLKRIKKDMMQVFEQGMKIPVPYNPIVLGDLIDPNRFDRLGDFIDHFHAPYLPPSPDFSPDPDIPMGEENPPTLLGLLHYLEAHWLPTLLKDEVEGLGIHLKVEEDNPEHLTFGIGIHVTEEGIERIPLEKDPDGLLHKLYEEMEGKNL
jgi:hypothetical protein